MDSILSQIENDMQEISIRISEAVKPLNAYTMPLVVLSLENYALAMKNDAHFDKEAYELIKKISGSVMVRVDCKDPEAMSMYNHILKEKKSKNNQL